MNNRTRAMLLTFLGTLIVAILSLNATYSYMKNKTSGDRDTDVNVNSCAKISLEENNGTINLTNMYPMDDEMGLQTEAYDFTISSTCDNYVGFNLYLTTYTSDIEDSKIKFAITSKNDTVLASDLLTAKLDGTNDFTEAEKSQLNNGVTKDYKSIYKVYTNNIPLKGESEYKLRIWLDKSLDDSNVESTTMGKTFSIGVSVKSFDRDESMAEYLIKNKDNTLIYHDGVTDYDGMANANLEAGDYSYRYSGSSTDVHNYICFGGECSDNSEETEKYSNLYRIIGLFKNDLNLYEMKIIKADGATKNDLGETTDGGAYKGDYKSISGYSTYESYYQGKIWDNVAAYYWNSTAGTNLNNNNVNMWKESNLNKVNLNQTFYNAIDETYQEMIEEHEWQVGPDWNDTNAKLVYDYELGDNKLTYSSNKCYTQGNSAEIRLCIEAKDLTYPAYVGLMYVSDYMYGTSPENWNNKASYYAHEEVKNSNWLYLGLFEWTISRNSNVDDGTRTWRVGYTGYAGSNNYVHNGDGVRPVMYLSSNVKKASTSGDGTSSSPYLITQ